MRARLQDLEVKVDFDVDTTPAWAMQPGAVKDPNRCLLRVAAAAAVDVHRLPEQLPADGQLLGGAAVAAQSDTCSGASITLTPPRQLDCFGRASADSAWTAVDKGARAHRTSSRSESSGGGQYLTPLPDTGCLGTNLATQHPMCSTFLSSMAPSSPPTAAERLLLHGLVPPALVTSGLRSWAGPQCGIGLSPSHVEVRNFESCSELFVRVTGHRPALRHYFTANAASALFVGNRNSCTGRLHEAGLYLVST